MFLSIFMCHFCCYSLYNMSNLPSIRPPPPPPLLHITNLTTPHVISVTSQSSSSESAPSLPRTDPPNMTKPPVLSTNHQPVSIMSTRKKPPPPRRASTALASTGRTLPPVPTDLRNHKKNMWRQRRKFNGWEVRNRLGSTTKWYIPSVVVIELGKYQYLCMSTVSFL